MNRDDKKHESSQEEKEATSTKARLQRRLHKGLKSENFSTK